MKRIVIVGNSAAGISCAQTIRKKDSSSNISIISQEKHNPYLRLRLLDYLEGNIAKKDLFYLNEDFYSKNKIELISGREVIRINEKRKAVFLDDKSNLDYDVLFLASGAISHVPEIKGTHKYGVFEIRSLDDVEKILEIVPVVSDVCIIGSGSLGLRAAAAFRKRNLDVTVVTKSKSILASYLDQASSQIVQKMLEDKGINFILDQEVLEIIGEGEARAIKLEQGKVIASSLVLVAKGSFPSFNFIKDTEIDKDRGIIVDKNFRTNIPNIYAAGEVCQCYNFLLEKYDISHGWEAALRQGELTGENISGNPVEYEGFFNSKSLRLFDIEIFSAGNFNTEEGLEEIKIFDEKILTYKKVLIKDNKILGAILINDLADRDKIVGYIKDKRDILTEKNQIFLD